MSSLRAEEFNLNPGRRDWWRPPAVLAVTQPMEDDAPQIVPTAKGYTNAQFPLVKALCLEIRAGITTQALARLAGIDSKVASSYLSRLQQQGVLEFDPKRIKTNGRPAKVYRVREAA
jgi:response regulator of citrate/malate metabolism